MVGSLSSDAYRELVRMLVAARREAGLKQIELAERLGKPQSFVSKVERAERRLDVVELVVVLRAMRLDPLVMLARIADQIDPDTGLR